MPDDARLTFLDERGALYLAWLDRHANLDELTETLVAFRTAFPDAQLTFPDLWLVCSSPQRSEVLQRILRLRSSEAEARVIAAMAIQRRRAAVTEAKGAVLRLSRVTLAEVTEAMDVALGDLLVDCRPSGSAPVCWQAVDQATQRYRQRLLQIVGGGAKPSHLGSDGRWTGEGPDAADVQFLMAKRREGGQVDEDDLLVNEGGIYTTIPAGPLRRDHAAKLVASDALLLARALRYRGGKRANESKGLFAEEGWRRILSQVITGRRDTLNTRSRRQLHALLTPWIAAQLANRVRRLMRTRWGHLPGDRETRVQAALSLLRSTATAVLTLPPELVGISADPPMAAAPPPFAAAGLLEDLVDRQLRLALAG